MSKWIASASARRKVRGEAGHTSSMRRRTRYEDQAGAAGRRAVDKKRALAIAAARASGLKLVPEDEYSDVDYSGRGEGSDTTASDYSDAPDADDLAFVAGSDEEDDDGEGDDSDPHPSSSRRSRQGPRGRSRSRSPVRGSAAYDAAIMDAALAGLRSAMSSTKKRIAVSDDETEQTELAELAGMSTKESKKPAKKAAAAAAATTVLSDSEDDKPAKPKPPAKKRPAATPAKAAPAKKTPVLHPLPSLPPRAPVLTRVCTHRRR